MDNYLYLCRLTSIKIEEKDVKSFLRKCKLDKKTPDPLDFLDYIGNKNSFNDNETIDATDIDNADDFYKLIEEND